MMRLGLLMAITMTLHNLPEGFAVAFTAFTPLGPVMALAIAMHNIPEVNTQAGSAQNSVHTYHALRHCLPCLNEVYESMKPLLCDPLSA